MPVDLQNLIAGLKAGLRGRFVGGHIPDRCGRFRFHGWFAYRPDDHRKKQCQHETEKGTGECHDNLVQRTHGRKILSLEAGFALDGVHWRHLWKQNESSGRYPSQAVLNAVDVLFPDRPPKPDPEFVDVQPSPPSGQKMAQFMNDNEEIKNE